MSPPLLNILLALSQALVAPQPPPKAADIDRLAEQLGSPSFQEREAASKALEKIGERALPILKQAARSPDAEVRKRATALFALLHGRARTKAVAHLKQLGGSVRFDPTS